MQPQLAAKIEKATRKQFPDGIHSHGTDALRYTFSLLALTGRDIKFDIGRMEGYCNFCNKIWNASRYVLSHTADHELSAADASPSLADLWIKSRLQATLAQIEEAYDSYRFDLASQALYDFIWNEFCDWYLELSKPVLWDDTADPRTAGGAADSDHVLEHLSECCTLCPSCRNMADGCSPRRPAWESIMLAPWPARRLIRRHRRARNPLAQANHHWHSHHPIRG